MLISLFDRVEKIVGEGENAGYQHFLLFPHCFQKASFQGLLKVGIVSNRVKTSHNSLFQGATETIAHDMKNKGFNNSEHKPVFLCWLVLPVPSASDF